MKRIVWKIAIAVGAAAALIYVSDFGILEFRIVANRNPYGSVNVRTYYEIQEKNARTEYVFGSSQDQPCVNSLIPHKGLPACWYLRRHPEQPIHI